jgi:hypothetical protein
MRSARDCLATVWMARRDVDPNLAARFRRAIQAAAVWANQEENERASGAILAKYSELDPALIARVTRTLFAPRLRPELAQPWIDLYVEFGVIPSSSPAIDLTNRPSAGRECRRAVRRPYAGAIDPVHPETKPDAGPTCCIRDTARSPGTHLVPRRARTGRARQGKVSGYRPFAMPPPGIEPGTFGLRVRCSAS